jgi:hypothetical protein
MCMRSLLRREQEQEARNAAEAARLRARKAALRAAEAAKRREAEEAAAMQALQAMEPPRVTTPSPPPEESTPSLPPARPHRAFDPSPYLLDAKPRHARRPTPESVASAGSRGMVPSTSFTGPATSSSDLFLPVSSLVEPEAPEPDWTYRPGQPVASRPAEVPRARPSRREMRVVRPITRAESSGNVVAPELVAPSDGSGGRARATDDADVVVGSQSRRKELLTRLMSLYAGAEVGRPKKAKEPRPRITSAGRPVGQSDRSRRLRELSKEPDLPPSFSLQGQGLSGD